MLTFTATVAPGTAGTVTFLDNGFAIAGGANVAIAGGVATIQISTLSTGAHSITASYSGATGFTASTSNTVTFVSGSITSRSTPFTNPSSVCDPPAPK